MQPKQTNKQKNHTQNSNTISSILNQYFLSEHSTYLRKYSLPQKVKINLSLVGSEKMEMGRGTREGSKIKTEGITLYTLLVIPNKI